MKPVKATTYDVIVLGIGTMGAAACYHLAQRGHSVLGLEQHAIPHQLGAHHGFSRMIRLAYYEHPDYVPLLRRAYELWHVLQANHGEALLHLTGGLYIGKRGGSFIDGALASAAQHQLTHRLLERSEIEAEFPSFRLQSGHVGFYEDQAGFLVPESVMAAHVLGALNHGATLRGHEEVISWDTDRDGVQVRTNRENYRARRLVITAGAWTAKVLADLALPLTVTRQTWGWFWPEDPGLFSMKHFPCWFYEGEEGAGHYGFPMMPDNPGFKLALHHPGEVTSPESVDREVRAVDEEQLRQFLAKHIPGADGELLAIRTCLYTNSPDGHFIVDQHPQHKRVSIACGFSGHGFKFASVMGELLADLATTAQTALPAAFLSLSRFR